MLKGNTIFFFKLLFKFQLVIIRGNTIFNNLSLKRNFANSQNQHNESSMLRTAPVSL